MSSAISFSKSGAKAASTTKLDKDVFGLEVKNHDLVKQAYVTYLANGRLNLAVTKTRGEVSGGGKKPWKQKGTGRARFGSSRVPIWRGGGITFGPTGIENYSKSMTPRSKRLALKQALSLKANEDRIVVIESFATAEPRTKLAVDLLSKIGAGTRSVVLVVVSKTEDLLRSTSNIPGLILVTANYLNTYDVLNADKIVFESGALPAVYSRLKTTEKAAAL